MDHNQHLVDDIPVWACWHPILVHEQIRETTNLDIEIQEADELEDNPSPVGQARRRLIEAIDKARFAA